MTAVRFEYIQIKENHEPLVNLINYNFILEPMYYKAKLSATNEMFLRRSVVEKLTRIQNKLKTYRLKIWDGYRPRTVQNNIYNKFIEEIRQNHPKWSKKIIEKEATRFVANPYDTTIIPPHTTGGTVDLTLVDYYGRELDMGTKFDYFGKEAHPFYFDGKNEIISNNRKLLRDTMLEQGFTIDPEEWWHFDFGNQQWAYAQNKNNAIYGEIV